MEGEMGTCERAACDNSLWRDKGYCSVYCRDTDELKSDLLALVRYHKAYEVWHQNPLAGGQKIRRIADEIEAAEAALSERAKMLLSLEGQVSPRDENGAESETGMLEE